MTVTPRTRNDRLPRNVLTSPSVGDESFPLDCPRCGWPCKYLHPVYWDSPWNDFGGMCGQCKQDAARRFDDVGWPPRPKDPEPETPAEVEPQAPAEPEPAPSPATPDDIEAAVTEAILAYGKGDKFSADDVMIDDSPTGRSTLIRTMRKLADAGSIERTGMFRTIDGDPHPEYRRLS